MLPPPGSATVEVPSLRNPGSATTHEYLKWIKGHFSEQFCFERQIDNFEKLAFISYLLLQSYQRNGKLNFMFLVAPAFLKLERLILSLVCLYGWLFTCGQLCPLFTTGGSWDFLKLDWFTWLLSFLPIIYNRWLMRFFKIRLVYLTFELFANNPGKCFCLGYQPVTQKSNKPDKWLRSDTMLKSILVL